MKQFMRLMKDGMGRIARPRGCVCKRAEHGDFGVWLSARERLRLSAERLRLFWYLGILCMRFSERYFLLALTYGIRRRILQDRKSDVSGKSGDLGGRPIIKKQ